MDGKYESGRIGNFKSKIKTTQTTKKYDVRTQERKTKVIVIKQKTREEC